MSELERHMQKAPLPPSPPSSVTTAWVNEYTDWFDQLNIIVGRRYGDAFLLSDKETAASK